MKTEPIQVERTPFGSTIQLPYRDLQKTRMLGWVPLGFGMFILMFMLSWMSGSIVPGINMVKNGEAFGYFLILFGLMGLPGLLFAISFLVLGQTILRNRTRGLIEIRDQRLIYRERIGWFSKTFKKVQLEDLTRLEIVDVKNLFRVESGSSHAKLDSWLPADSSCIRVFDTAESSREANEKPGIAIAYPQAQLLALAPILTEEIIHAAKRHGLTLPDVDQWRPRLANDRRVDAGLVDATDDAYPIDEHPTAMQQPANSKIEILRSPGQPTVFRLPATGLKGHAGSLFAFSCFWNAIVLLISIFFMVALISNPGQGFDLFIFPLFLVPFLGIGIAILVYSLSLARRTSMIGIDDHQLFCETKGLRNTTWIEIDRDDIESIRVEDSGTSVNDRSLRQIRISRQDKSNKPAVMFTGLPDKELEWICYQLKAELGLINSAKTDLD